MLNIFILQFNCILDVKLNYIELQCENKISYYLYPTSIKSFLWNLSLNILAPTPIQQLPTVFLHWLIVMMGRFGWNGSMRYQEPNILGPGHPVVPPFLYCNS